MATLYDIRMFDLLNMNRKELEKFVLEIRRRRRVAPTEIQIKRERERLKKGLMSLDKAQAAKLLGRLLDGLRDIENSTV